ncbi:hypothetical protein [uncultured Mucilaginibacter sp.]|uniref:hypothetical protein n=1 Tax=uncultured Mucilaginibacter sp. TaxID=797541 RepID=UPI0025DC4422|nr:hypothetical protein [uncultured Mucilaginibacter sp.]
MIESKRDFCTHRASLIDKYTYNEKHFLIKSTFSEDRDLVSKTEYQYLQFDSHNNWIKRIQHGTFYDSYDSVIANHHNPKGDSTANGKEYNIQSLSTDTTTRKITYY